MIRAVIVMGLIRMIEVVLVLVEEGIFGLTRTSRVVVVILEEVEVPSKRLAREICFRYVLTLCLVSKDLLTWMWWCQCLMSFCRQQAVGMKSSKTRQWTLPGAGTQKGVSVLAIHCSGSPKVEVMSLVHVRMCEMRLGVTEEAFEVVHCKDL